MKRLVSLIIVLMCMAFCHAQVRIYSGNTNAVIAKYENSKLYVDGEVVYNVRGWYLYNENSHDRNSIVFSCKYNKIFAGDKYYRSNIVYTVDNTAIYKGDSDYRSYLLYYIKDNKIYYKDGYTVIFRFDENIPLLIKIGLINYFKH